MRAVGEPGRDQEIGRPLAQRPAQNVENPAQGMGATRQGGGLDRLEQRPLRDAYVNVLIETVIEQDLRIEHVDHVRADEHLEHCFAEVEVDGTFRLRVRAFEVKYGLVPSRQRVQAIL